MAYFRLHRFFQVVTSLGESKCRNPRLAKRIVLSNKIALLMGFASLPYFFLYRFMELPSLAWIALLCTAVYFTVPWMNHKGWIIPSRIALMIFSGAAIFGSACALGKPSGIQLFLLPCAWVSLILFDWEERKSIIFGVAWASILLLVFELFGQTGNPVFATSEKELRLIHFSVLTLILVGQILVVFYFFQANRKSEQDLWKATEAAKAANNAKSQFLASMSHEIRTPLNGVLGMTNLLLKTDLNEDQKELVQAIQGSGQDLMVIISEILDLSKIEAGKMQLEETPFNLKEIVQSALRPFKHEAEQKTLDFKVEMPMDWPTQIIGDPYRLKQVINNILGNALKFTHAGGVSFKLKNAWHAPMNGGSKEFILVEIEIGDTGIGIAESEMARLFKPFSQAQGTSARKYGGTGLGLFLSKQIVEMMGGTLSLQSQVDKGSTFTIRIPFPIGEDFEATDKRKQDQDAESNQKQSVKLLIVEDHPLNQKVLMGFLEYLHCQIDVVGSGQEAIEKCSRLPYPLIFMDCHMPGMDGFSTTRALRKLPHIGEAAIIIGVTADAMAGTREKCLESGMNDVLTKPILSNDINRLLAHWLPIAGQIPLPEKRAVSRETWIDIIHLREMDDWLIRHNPEYWEQATVSFRSSAALLLSSMAAAGRAGNLKEMGESAHTLKGLCLMMGLSTMGKACRKLESTKDTSLDWQAEVLSLEAALEPSLVEMHQFISRHRLAAKVG